MILDNFFPRIRETPSVQNVGETELRAFMLSPFSLFPSFSLTLKKRNRMKRELAVMATKKCTEYRFIQNVQNSIWEIVQCNNFSYSILYLVESVLF